HWIITVERFFLAFLGSARDPLRFYMDNSQPTSGVNNTLEIMAVLVGDAVIIHRLWIIWNRDLRVIFVPLISWLGGLSEVSPCSRRNGYLIVLTVCGIRVVCLFIQSTPSNEQFFIADGAWVTAYWALTAMCATNSIPNSAFIACRIWKTSRATAEVGGDLLRPVFGILIESAAIWTAWAIFFAATYLTGSTLLFLVRDLTPSIIGLVNLLIYLRVGLGCSRADATGPPMTSSTSMFAVNITTVNEEYCLESVSETGPTSNQSAF
ncbi:hypothetical protein C8R44DRAFT_603400, partial [Mycena epipterygia]